MQCPECKHRFGFYTIPLDDRLYKAMYVIFKCPACGTWLKPNKRYATLLNTALIVLAIGIGASFLDMLEIAILPGWAASGLLVTGFVLFILAFFFRRLVIINHDTSENN